MTDDHPKTALSYNSVAANLNAQGKYREVRDVWLAAAKSQDAARLLLAFTGPEGAAAKESYRPALAAVLAGSISRPRRSSRWKRTSAAACSTSWPRDRVNGWLPASVLDSES